MMRKQLLVILSAAFIAAGAAGGLALKQVSAEEPVSGKATVTVKLNGGFRIVTSGDNPSFSTEDYVKQVDGGTVELTHEYLKNNLFGRELIFPLYNGENRPESGTNEVNGVVYDSEGKFYFQVRREINPFESAYLFGVFEDTNNNGVKDEGEKEYRSGDEIEMKDGLVLTCFYEDNNQYDLWTDNDGMCQMAVSLAKAWKKDESNKPAAGTATYYTARQVQPFQMKVNTINPFAYGTGIYYGDTRGIEIPDTVNVLANYAFAFLTQLEYVYGTENVELIAHGAFGSSGCDNGTERTYVVGSIYDLFSSAGTFEYCGAGKFNVVVRGKKSSGSPFNVTSNVKVFQGKNATIEEPKAHVFVPYGMTKDFYPMTTEAGNEYTVAGQSVSGNVASLGGYPMQQIATDGSAISVPLREMQEITFDLNGGRINGKKTIRATYMDAGAKSVTRNGKELNVSETGDSKNGISLNPTAVNYSYLKAQKPAEPVLEDAVFAGWKDENGYIWTEEDWNNGGRAGYTVKTIKLTAVYKESATVTYKLNNGESDVVANTFKNELLVRPTDPKAPTHKVFKAWYKDENHTQEWDFDSDIVSEKSITLYAAYEYATYTAKLYTDGGTLEESEIVEAVNDYYQQKFIYNTETNLPVPVKEGYTFKGWYEKSDLSGNAVDVIAKGKFGSPKYYAKWAKEVVSNVTYELDGGTNAEGNPVSYTEGTVTKLSEPVKEGYTFKGWYKTADFSGTAITEIGSDYTGDLTFYAKWEKIKSADDKPGEDKPSDGGSSEESKKGCKGSVGSMIALTAIAGIACVVAVRKKKKD